MSAGEERADAAGDERSFGPSTRAVVARTIAAVEHERAVDAEQRARRAEARASAAEAETEAERDRVTAAEAVAAEAWSQTAALQERLREKALLLGEFEHKLKTAFAVIAGYASLVERDWDNLAEEHRRESVSTIRRKAEEVVAQAEKLLQDAAAEIQLLEPRPVHLDLAAFVQQLVEHHQGAIRDHSLQYHGPSRLITTVDPHAIDIVVAQLVENARKYSPAGSRITVSLADHNDGIEIAVTDEGPGLPDGVDVFAAFTRGTTTIAGSGLGLYMARRQATAVGATLSAANSPGGRGARFALAIPRPAAGR